MDSYSISRRIQQLDRYAPFPGEHHGSSNGHRESTFTSLLYQPWSMTVASSGRSGHDAALRERGQSDVFFDDDIDLTPGCGRLHQPNTFLVNLQHRVCYVQRAAESSKEISAKKCLLHKILHNDHWMAQRFPLTVKCVPSAASKLPLRHGSVGMPDCTSVTAEPVSISIFVGHPSILPATAIRSLPWYGCFRVVIASPPS
ncbi:hypothetical protein T10_11131 [Trichinella papuae]|uniref:Uncharacterized protein n=1 Tax=Trichinella papuae TaxID=268474 RepID=A0A0V1MNN8_9BILA|nr:hypothetical protein T10_11131 [Trichinella papuae]